MLLLFIVVIYVSYVYYEWHVCVYVVVRCKESSEESESRLEEALYIFGYLQFSQYLQYLTVETMDWCVNYIELPSRFVCHFLFKKYFIDFDIAN